MYEYKAVVIRVVDGDTFDADVDLGFNLTMKARFRLNDVDTPEIFRPKSRAESEHGYEATEFVKSLALNAVVTLRTTKDVGIYGRYGAEVIFDDGSSLAALLKEQGFEKKEEY